MNGPTGAMTTMHTPETLAMFRRLVEQAIGSAEHLIAALDEEHAALQQPDPGVLERAVQDKLGQLRELEQRVAAQQGFLAARRLPDGKRGIELFLKGLPPEASERELWSRLEQLAATCQQRNAINGSIVSLRTVRTQRALQVLVGAAGTPRVYGRKGNTSLGGRSQLLGSV